MKSIAIDVLGLHRHKNLTGILSELKLLKSRQITMYNALLDAPLGNSSVIDLDEASCDREVREINSKEDERKNHTESCNLSKTTLSKEEVKKSQQLQNSMMEKDSPIQMCNNCHKLQQEYQSQKKMMETNLTVLKQKILTTDELIKDYQKKVQENARLGKKVADLSEKLNKCYGETGAMRIQLEKARQANEPLKKTARRFEVEKKIAEDQVTDLSEKLRQAESKLSDITSETAIQGAKSSSLNKDVAQLTKENENLREKIRKFQEEKQQLKNDLKSNKATNRKSQSAAKTAEKKFTKLTEKLEQYKEKYEELKKDLKHASPKKKWTKKRKSPRKSLNKRTDSISPPEDSASLLQPSILMSQIGDDMADKSSSEDDTEMSNFLQKYSNASFRNDTLRDLNTPSPPLSPIPPSPINPAEALVPPSPLSYDNSDRVTPPVHDICPDGNEKDDFSWVNFSDDSSGSESSSSDSEEHGPEVAQSGYFSLKGSYSSPRLPIFENRTDNGSNRKERRNSEPSSLSFQNGGDLTAERPLKRSKSSTDLLGVPELSFKLADENKAQKFKARNYKTKVSDMASFPVSYELNDKSLKPPKIDDTEHTVRDNVVLASGILNKSVTETASVDNASQIDGVKPNMKNEYECTDDPQYAKYSRKGDTDFCENIEANGKSSRKSKTNEKSGKNTRRRTSSRLKKSAEDCKVLESIDSSHADIENQMATQPREVSNNESECNLGRVGKNNENGSPSKRIGKIPGSKTTGKSVSEFNVDVAEDFKEDKALTEQPKENQLEDSIVSTVASMDKVLAELNHKSSSECLSEDDVVRVGCSGRNGKLDGTSEKNKSPSRKKIRRNRSRFREFSKQMLEDSSGDEIEKVERVTRRDSLVTASGGEGSPLKTRRAGSKLKKSSREINDSFNGSSDRATNNEKSENEVISTNNACSSERILQRSSSRVMKGLRDDSIARSQGDIEDKFQIAFEDSPKRVENYDKESKELPGILENKSSLAKNESQTTGSAFKSGNDDVFNDSIICSQDDIETRIQEGNSEVSSSELHSENRFGRITTDERRGNISGRKEDSPLKRKIQRPPYEDILDDSLVGSGDCIETNISTELGKSSSTRATSENVFDRIKKKRRNEDLMGKSKTRNSPSKRKGRKASLRKSPNQGRPEDVPSSGSIKPSSDMNGVGNINKRETPAKSLKERERRRSLENITDESKSKTENKSLKDISNTLFVENSSESNLPEISTDHKLGNNSAISNMETNSENSDDDKPLKILFKSFQEITASSTKSKKISSPKQMKNVDNFGNQNDNDQIIAADNIVTNTEGDSDDEKPLKTLFKSVQDNDAPSCKSEEVKSPKPMKNMSRSASGNNDTNIAANNDVDSNKDDNLGEVEASSSIELMPGKEIETLETLLDENSNTSLDTFKEADPKAVAFIIENASDKISASKSTVGLSIKKEEALEEISIISNKEIKRNEQKSMTEKLMTCKTKNEGRANLDESTKNLQMKNGRKEINFEEKSIDIQDSNMERNDVTMRLNAPLAQQRRKVDGILDISNDALPPADCAGTEVKRDLSINSAKVKEKPKNIGRINKTSGKTPTSIMDQLKNARKAAAERRIKAKNCLLNDIKKQVSSCPSPDRKCDDVADDMHTCADKNGKNVAFGLVSNDDVDVVIVGENIGQVSIENTNSSFGIAPSSDTDKVSTGFCQQTNVASTITNKTDDSYSIQTFESTTTSVSENDCENEKDSTYIDASKQESCLPKEKDKVLKGNCTNTDELALSRSGDISELNKDGSSHFSISIPSKDNKLIGKNDEIPKEGDEIPKKTDEVSLSERKLSKTPSNAETTLLKSKAKIKVPETVPKVNTSNFLSHLNSVNSMVFEASPKLKSDTMSSPRVTRSRASKAAPKVDVSSLCKRRSKVKSDPCSTPSSRITRSRASKAILVKDSKMLSSLGNNKEEASNKIAETLSSSGLTKSDMRKSKINAVTSSSSSLETRALEVKATESVSEENGSDFEPPLVKKMKVSEENKIKFASETLEETLTTETSNNKATLAEKEAKDFPLNNQLTNTLAEPQMDSENVSTNNKAAGELVLEHQTQSPALTSHSATKNPANLQVDSENSISARPSEEFALKHEIPSTNHMPKNDSSELQINTGSLLPSNILKLKPSEVETHTDRSHSSPALERNISETVSDSGREHISLSHLKNPGFSSANMNYLSNPCTSFISTLIASHQTDTDLSPLLRIPGDTVSKDLTTSITNNTSSLHMDGQSNVEGCHLVAENRRIQSDPNDSNATEQSKSRERASEGSLRQQLTPIMKQKAGEIGTDVDISKPVNVSKHINIFSSELRIDVDSPEPPMTFTRDVRPQSIFSSSRSHRPSTENILELITFPSVTLSPLPPSPSRQRVTPLLSPLPVTPQPELLSPLCSSPELLSPPTLRDAPSELNVSRSVVTPKPMVVTSSSTVRAIDFKFNDNKYSFKRFTGTGNRSKSLDVGVSAGKTVESKTGIALTLSGGLESVSNNGKDNKINAKSKQRKRSLDIQGSAVKSKDQTSNSNEELIPLGSDRKKARLLKKLPSELAEKRADACDSGIKSDALPKNAPCAIREASKVLPKTDTSSSSLLRISGSNDSTNTQGLNLPDRTRRQSALPKDTACASKEASKSLSKTDANTSSLLRISDTNPFTKTKDLPDRTKGQSELKYVKYCFCCLRNGAKLSQVSAKLSVFKNISSSTTVVSAIISNLKSSKENLLDDLKGKWNHPSSFADSEDCVSESNGGAKTCRTKEMIGKFTRMPFLAAMEEKILCLVAELKKIQHLNAVLKMLLQLIPRAVFSEEGLTDNGLHSLCRTFAALCRLVNDSGQLRGFIFKVAYHSMLSAKLDSILLSCFCVWPAVFESNFTSSKREISKEKILVSPMSCTLQIIALWIAVKNGRGLLSEMLHKIFGWVVTVDGGLTFLIDTLLAILEDGEHRDIDKNLEETNEFEVLKSLEVLAVHMGWEWCHNYLISERLWAIFRNWSKGLGTNTSSNNAALDAVFVRAITLIGLLSRIGISGGYHLRNPTGFERLLVAFCGILNTNFNSKVSLPVQVAAAYTLVNLSPVDPLKVSSVLWAWLRQKDAEQVPEDLAIAVKSIANQQKVQS